MSDNMRRERPAGTGEVMEAYEAGAATYADAYEAEDCGAWSMAAVEAMVVYSLLRGIPFQDVLDAGTGGGRYALRLARMGKRVTGSDSSGQMLKIARTRAGQLGVGVQFNQATVLALPYRDQSFDLVVCALTLAHVKELPEAIRELVRVLRAGGHLVITDAHPDIQRAWGPEYTALVHCGRLHIDGSAKEAIRASHPDAREVPFPNYHDNVEAYVDAVKSAGADLLAAIDVPMQQLRGLYPGPLVVFARRPAG
jgi:ubiquinone/menaquinone biosynthesis C-methylase UbiE